MNRYLLIFIFLLYNTVVINYFDNKSNYSSYLIVPLINALLVKYYFGDFDNGDICGLYQIFLIGLVLLWYLLLFYTV